MIENPFMIKTAEGFDVVSIIPTSNGTDDAIIFRKTQEKQDYIIARNYNVKDGTWGQGYYDYPTLEAAKTDYDKKYPVSAIKTQKEKRKMNNSLVLQGTVAENMEVKTSENGKKYIRIPLEVEREYNGKTIKQTFTVSMFGDHADSAVQFKAGDNVLIKGCLLNNKYKDNVTLALVGNSIEKGDGGSKNTLKISGFINNKTLELKTNEKGNKSLTVALSVKNEYGDGYETFFVRAFGKSAEILSQYKQHDLVELQGSVQTNEQGVLTATAFRSELLRNAVKDKNTTDKQRSNSNVDENGNN